MKATLNIDVNHGYETGKFFQDLEEFGKPRIENYIAVGPGGGNPNFTLVWEGDDAKTQATNFALGCGYEKSHIVVE